MSASADLEVWRPTADDPWDSAKAAHLLRRAGFAAAPKAVAQACELGMDGAVDWLLTVLPDPDPEWGTLVLPHGEALEVNRDLGDQRAAWLYRILHGDQPLREKAALFWHDHLSVGARQTHNRFHLQPHVNLLRRHALGNLRELLRSLLRDPALLVWLDNYCNGRPSDGVPRVNLNLGRELLELYTMGARSGYTQDDVVAAAQCLTGWSMLAPITSNVTYFRADWHVPGAKRVLGTVIHNDAGHRDALDLVDVLLQQPATAHYLTGKVWRWFVTDTAPPPLLHAELAAFFAASGYDMHAMLSLLLRARVFYASDTRGARVRGPIEFVVSALSALGLPPVRNLRALAGAVVAMGEPWLDYLTPAGVEEGVAWLSTQRLVERMRFARELLRDDNRFGCVLDWSRLDGELPREPQDRAAALVQRSVGDLGDATLHAQCAAALRAAPDGRSGLRAALTCLFSSPHFQCC